MARDAAEWLEKHELLCRTVTIKVRYSDFTTITRSHSKTPATRDGEDIAQRAVKLLERTDAAARPVRLLGVSTHGRSETPPTIEGPEPPEGTSARWRDQEPVVIPRRTAESGAASS